MTAGTTKFRCSCGVGKRVAVASTDITIQTKHTKPNLPKPNLLNQTYQTKPTKYKTKPTKPNHTYITKPTKPSQTYQTKPTKPNLPKQIKLSLPSILNQAYQTQITCPSSQGLGP